MVDVVGTRVDDDVADVALPHFPQDLAVGGRRRLADVHLDVLGRRRAHQILKPDQSCCRNKTETVTNINRIESLNYSNPD